MLTNWPLDEKRRSDLLDKISAEWPVTDVPRLVKNSVISEEYSAVPWPVHWPMYEPPFQIACDASKLIDPLKDTNRVCQMLASSASRKATCLAMVHMGYRVALNPWSDDTLPGKPITPEAYIDMARDYCATLSIHCDNNCGLIVLQWNVWKVPPRTP